VIFLDHLFLLLVGIERERICLEDLALKSLLSEADNTGRKIGNHNYNLEVGMYACPKSGFSAFSVFVREKLKKVNERM